jgi:hypothetical protein
MLLLATDIDKQLERVFVKLKKFSPSDQEGSRIVREVALNNLAQMRDRIQNRGEASAGGDIGTYSKKPIYVPVDEMVGKKLKPEGKNFKGKRRSTFASGKRKGKPHKSRYFEDGYEGYKNEIGRNTLGKVNLTLSGQFFNQMQLFPTSKGWGIGWSNSAMLKRAKGFESSDYFGKKIFSPTRKERSSAVSLAKKLTEDAISR